MTAYWSLAWFQLIVAVPPGEARVAPELLPAPELVVWSFSYRSVPAVQA
jgi:hypothetical protein